MKKIGIIVLGLFVTFASFSQEKKSTWKYAKISFIKTTPGGEFAKFLEEKSAVIYQDRANSGNIFGWDVWQVTGSGGTSSTSELPYDIVAVTLYNSLDSLLIGKDINWKIIANYSDQDIKNNRENLNESREIVNTAIITLKHSWSKNEDASDYATFSYVKVKEGSQAEYESMVTKMSANGITNTKVEAVVLNKRIDLWGEDIGWDYLNVWFYDKWSDGLEQRAATSAPSENGMKLISLREVKKGEVMHRIYSIRKKAN